MITSLRRQGRSGFTLLELLIAMGLSGVVLAIAMKGFIDSNKMSNLAKSRLEVHNYGSNGARQAAQLLRQAQIIYYTGRPLANVTPSTTAIKFGKRGAANTPPQLALPTIFTNNAVAPVGSTPFVPGAQTTTVDYANPQPINIFRFSENLGALTNRMLEVAPAARDTSAAGTRNYFYNNCFPAPLAYFATAEFSTSVPDVGTTSPVPTRRMVSGQPPFAAPGSPTAAATWSSTQARKLAHPSLGTDDEYPKPFAPVSAMSHCRCFS